MNNLTETYQINSELAFYDSSQTPLIDPFHNSEVRELTTATITEQKNNKKPGKQVYINRMGAIVSSWEI